MDPAVTASAAWQWPPGVEIPGVVGWPVVLRAGALVLRPLRRRDEAAWEDVRTRNAAWLKPWEATPPPEAGPWRQTVAQMRAQQWRQGKAGTGLTWMMAWDDGWPAASGPVERTALIGAVTVAGITYGSARLASLGYWIAQDYAGRGLTPLGVALAIDYCLGVLRLHRIQIDIRPDNLKSLRVAAKLGLRAEGLKPRYLHINGAWADHLAFAHDAEAATVPRTVHVLAGRGVPTG